MVSGNFDPKVSGMIMAKIPAIRLDTPIMISGASPFIAAKIGAAIPPIPNKIKRLVFNKIHLIVCFLQYAWVKYYVGIPYTYL